MTDFEAYFRLDKELEEAPLLEPEQKVLVRRWLHRFVELKENAAAPAATADDGRQAGTRPCHNYKENLDASQN